MEMIMEKGKERFLSVGFLPVVLRGWIAFDCADWKITQGTEMFGHISCTPGTCITLGFSLFPDLRHLKYRSSKSKTAKKFAHITAEFFVGVLGSLRQEKLSSSPCFHLLSIFCEAGVVFRYCGKGALNHRDTFL